MVYVLYLILFVAGGSTQILETDAYYSTYDKCHADGYAYVGQHNVDDGIIRGYACINVQVTEAVAEEAL